MTGRELTNLVGAKVTRRRGKRSAITTAVRFREWARGHQDILRDAFRCPDAAVDLTVGLSNEEATALGLVRLYPPYGPARWTSDAGDAEMERLLLMPRKEALALAAALRPLEFFEEAAPGRYPGVVTIVRGWKR